MLVLDRRLSQGFWIDESIFVKVLAVGHRRVKLGIEAPAGMKIMREELEPSASGKIQDAAGLPVRQGRERAGGSFRSVRG